jgi:type II secretory pathway pseudopilin PulG
MTSRLARLRADESGFTLIELLVGMGIFIVILSAVLVSFNAFEVNNNLANARNDSQQRARHELDLLARELRNLASPTPEQPQAVDKASAYDIVFQTVDPTAPGIGTLNTANVRRVRYCVNSSNPANEVLWQQWQTWTTATAPATPGTTNCPDDAWGLTNRREVTANVTNQINGQDRPLFAFNTTAVSEVNRVRADLYIDLTPLRNPSETHLTTGVFLRNQNRKPTASFTWTIAGNKHVVFNASASEDPEGAPLRYEWWDQGGTQAMGTGITCDCIVGGTGARSITLKVFDPAGLETDLTQSVTGIT